MVRGGRKEIIVDQAEVKNNVEEVGRNLDKTEVSPERLKCQEEREIPGGKMKRF
jgi:hypothetical protein